MCKASTDQGPIETDKGCPDFARLVASLTRRGPGQIEFVRLEHPTGGVLTLGAKTSRDGERLLRFRHVQADGVIHCTKRVEERSKLVGQLSEFFATGARGNRLAWIPTSSLIFDAEEANTRLRQQPHYPNALQNTNQEPLQFNQPASGAWKGFILPFAGVLLLILWGASRAGSRAEEEARKQYKAAERERYNAELTKQVNQASQERFFRERDSGPSSGYSSPLGNLWPGTALYHKGSLTPFGFVVDTEGGNIWVADSYRVGASRTSLYARSYSRSYITGNFVTK